MHNDPNKAQNGHKQIESIASTLPVTEGTKG